MGRLERPKVVEGLDPCDDCGAPWIDEGNGSPTQTHTNKCWTSPAKAPPMGDCGRASIPTVVASTTRFVIQSCSHSEPLYRGPLYLGLVGRRRYWFEEGSTDIVGFHSADSARKTADYVLGAGEVYKVVSQHVDAGADHHHTGGVS